jgi:phytoene dehydrogenase-like protein
MKTAVVVGAGPNGLVAATVLAEAGWSVRVLERDTTLGGGCRTAEVTLPGFHHDICSSIHPLAIASPAMKPLDLEVQGLEWIDPPVLLAHPFDDGSAAVLMQSIEQTADSLAEDASAYRELMEPLAGDFTKILPTLLGPVRPTRHAVKLAKFGLPALRSLNGLVESRFTGFQSKAMMAGLAAHAMIALDRRGTAAFALLLALTGHEYGWPFPKRGSQEIIDAIVRREANARISYVTEHEVRGMGELSGADAVLFNTSPGDMVRIAGTDLSPAYRKRVGRLRHGPGVFKIDYALSGPVKWTAKAANEAGTLHLSGTIDEINASENAVHAGKHPEQPFTLVLQPSRFDPTRAPDGQQTLGAYCHVPTGSDEDMTDAIERQLERFAPGFRDLVLARSTMTAREIEAYNPNYVGGDINGGLQDLRQLFTRPTLNAWDPYRTSNDRLFLCSSATPPGGGVHGMCGYHAAQSVLKKHGKG